jgi:hypothetical protein
MVDRSAIQVAIASINDAVTRLPIAKPLALTVLIGLAGFAIAESAQLSDETRNALTSCAFADPPPLRDGSSATRVDMEEMAIAVKKYSTDMQTALACIDDATQRSQPDQHQFTDFMYNNGIEQLNAILASYNERVKMYRRYESIRSISEVTP